MYTFRRKENQSGYFLYFTEESLPSDTEAADIQDELLIGAVRDVMIPKLSPDPNNNRSMISMTDPKNFVIHRYVRISTEGYMYEQPQKLCNTQVYSISVHPSIHPHTPLPPSLPPSTHPPSIHLSLPPSLPLSISPSIHIYNH